MAREKPGEKKGEDWVAPKKPDVAEAVNKEPSPKRIQFRKGEDGSIEIIPEKPPLTDPDAIAENQRQVAEEFAKDREKRRLKRAIEKESEPKNQVSFKEHVTRPFEPRPGDTQFFEMPESMKKKKEAQKKEEKPKSLLERISKFFGR